MQGDHNLLGKQEFGRFPGIQCRGQAVVCEHIGADFEEHVVRCQQPQRTSCTHEVRKRQKEGDEPHDT